MTKHVFVTGGVVSSLGKGITAASLGRLLKSRGYKVMMQKADPYLNVDPGTMSPFQHGEVFVTQDGKETDLDLGHYERFIDENLTRTSNFTTGLIYQSEFSKTWSAGTSQKLAILARMASSTSWSLRQTMKSGWMPRERSSLTECWVGLVFTSWAALM